jgi:hypothetical protein
MIAFVCGECLADEGLTRFVAQAASADACSFCAQTQDSPIAASVSDVALFMRQCLEQDYGHPAADHAGGYPPGAIFGTHSLLNQVPLQLRNPTVLGPLCEEIGLALEWCEKDPIRFTGADELLFRWFDFCRYVQHVCRFFVFAAPTRTMVAGDDEEHASPVALLERVGRIAVAAGALKTMPVSMPIFRARPIATPSEIRRSSDIGPPPPEKAKQNRMSAAGIPMFYGSDDPETAVTEARESPSPLYAVGEFRAERDVRVLDLTALPDIPAFFELGNRDLREEMKFLHSFADDISLPVKDPDSVHIEYVPTQAATEYFRSVFTDGGRNIDGIVYRSARRAGHRSLVLFATSDDVVPARVELDAGHLSVSELAREESDRVPWLALKTVRCVP